MADPRLFVEKGGLFRRLAPVALQRAMTPPLIDQDRRVFGYCELCIGKLGMGKTTWAVHRGLALAQRTGVDDRGMEYLRAGHSPPPECYDGSDRFLVSSGEWSRQIMPDGTTVGSDRFEVITGWGDLWRIWNAVVILDELHLIIPSQTGLIRPEDARQFVHWISLARKRNVDVVATSQAWTRVATTYRQLVTTVWKVNAVKKGKLHRAVPFENPMDGSDELWAPQFYDPRKVAIPTAAGAWAPAASGDRSGFAARSEQPA